jgi:DNA-directed RNA polymerase subunit M/transcription elongation factor TFIIS
MKTSNAQKKKFHLKKNCDTENNDDNNDFDIKYSDIMKKIDSDKDWIEKDYINRLKFHMKGSTDISFNLIIEAHKLINRISAINRIDQHVDDSFLSHNIEKGLFEFSLLHVTMKKLDYSSVTNVYEYKLHSICINLDENNSKIQNKTLLKAVKNGDLKPYIIAFLKPEQMHPEIWETFKQKQVREDDAMYNPDTTDEYECSRCKERKSTVEYIQTRGADEPPTKFITCVVCCTTVTLY